MAGRTSITIAQSLDEITARLNQARQPIVKERLQVLYWLKQEKAPSISKIAKAIGRHRGTLQEWLRIYRTEGLAALESVKSSPGGGNLCDSDLGRRVVVETITRSREWI